MPTSADLLLDTSAAVALVQRAHTHHDAVLAAVGGKRLGLAGHAQFETYSVLTRLPGSQRLSPAAAARVIETNFPAHHALAAAASSDAVSRFHTAGVSGGAVCDGLVALAANDAGITLLTCDRRPAQTYAALRTVFLLV